MVIDTSALVAVINRESGHESLMEAIADDRDPKISAATAVELQVVLARRFGCAPGAASTVLSDFGVRVIPFDADQMRKAWQGYQAYGAGSGGKAHLNLGDCFSYALATRLGEPLLFVGDDFAHTDVTSAT